MILVIDAYNVVKQAMLKNKISDKEREIFVSKLVKYHKIKGHKIELVFDGGPFDFPTKERVNGIYLIYAGVNESADEYIKRHLQKNKNEDILLVSSDREICNFAKRLNIEQIDAMDFYNILQVTLKRGVGKALSKKTEAIKLSEEKNEELDEIMKESSKTIRYKAEDFEFETGVLRESKAHKLPKKERKKLKKIKKL